MLLDKSCELCIVNTDVATPVYFRLKHFRTLSSPLLNIELYPTPQSQCKRFENAVSAWVYRHLLL